MRWLLLLVLLGISAPPPAAAQEWRHNGVVILDVWARATPPRARTGAVYLTMRNESAGDVRLTGATSPRAPRIELHTTRMAGDVARMERQPGIAVARGATGELKPGGAHIMLMGLAAPLKSGDTFPLTLTFGPGDSIEVLVAIR